MSLTEVSSPRIVASQPSRDNTLPFFGHHISSLTRSVVVAFALSAYSSPGGQWEQYPFLDESLCDGNLQNCQEIQQNTSPNAEYSAKRALMMACTPSGSQEACNKAIEERRIALEAWHANSLYGADPIPPEMLAQFTAPPKDGEGWNIVYKYIPPHFPEPPLQVHPQVQVSAIACNAPACIQ